MRVSGVTTRKVDKYIQDLFTKRFCNLVEEKDMRERKEICFRLQLRLSSEHDINPNDYLVGEDMKFLKLNESYELRKDL